MDVDVALVPAQADSWGPRVCVMVDELRASSTLTTLLDLGCPGVLVTASLSEGRRLARERGSLLAGERKGQTPRGFDANNSPTQLRGMGVGGREVILCTTNGTAVLSRLRRMPSVLVGCLLNARATAEVALRLADRRHTGIGIVCAGQRGRFALDDTVASGLIVEHLLAAASRQGRECRLTDAAHAAVRLRAAQPDDLTALRESGSGRQLAALGAGADIEFCSRADSTPTVPFLRPGDVLRIAVFEDGGDGDGPAGRLAGRGAPGPPSTEVPPGAADRRRPDPSGAEAHSDSSQPGSRGPLSPGRARYWRSP